MHIADPRQLPSGVFLYTRHPARRAMLTDGPPPEEQALAAQQMLMGAWPPEAATVAPAA